MGERVEHRRLAKTIAGWSAVVLAPTLSVGLLATFYWGSPHLARDLLIGVGVGVAASALWWSVFAQIAERQLRLLINSELDQQRDVLERGITELIEEVERNGQRWQDERLPWALYGANNGFDLRFNRDLTRDLERSRIYYFSGPTGIYVPARIQTREADRELRELRLRLIDPCSEFALKRAVKERMRRNENAGRTEEEIKDDLRRHLVLVHTELWRIRRSVTKIRLSYASLPVLHRIELFENRIYDSSIEREGRWSFPTTAQWDESHSSWTNAMKEFTAQDFVDFRITPQTSEQDLRAHLRSLGLKVDQPMDHYKEAYDREYLSRMRADLKKAREHEDVIDDGSDDNDD